MRRLSTYSDRRDAPLMPSRFTPKRILWLVVLLLLGAGAVVFALVAWSWRVPASIGLEDGRLRPCPDSPNCVCSQDQGSAAVEPVAIPSEVELENLIVQIRNKIDALPDAKVITLTSDYLHAEFWSKLRFVDDVEMLIDREARLIHLRSASRVGYSDLGVNRERAGMLRGLLTF